MINVEGFKLYSDVMLKYWDTIQRIGSFKFNVNGTRYTLGKSNGENTKCIHLYVGENKNSSILSIYKGYNPYDPEYMADIVNVQWVSLYQENPSISLNSDITYDTSNGIYLEEDEFNFHLDIMYNDNLFKECAKIFCYIKRIKSPIYCVEFRPRILNFHEVDLEEVIKSLSTTPTFWKCYDK